MINNGGKSRRSLKPWWQVLGPGIVSGASDNDPTTVASLAVIGSTTVYGLGWLVLLVVPMLSVVQAISAQVGMVSNCGLEVAVRKRYGKPWALLALAAVLIVNLLTLAADLEGGGAALSLLTQPDYRWFILPLAALAGAMLIFGNYRKIQKALVYLPLIFLAYVAAAILARPNWADVLRGSLIPHFSFSTAMVSGAIALLGTTLTAYAYVWQTIEMSEETTPLKRLGLVQVDATLGTVIAGLSFWFIVIATGATLGVHHKTVQTAQDAAAALTPFAGHFASVLFGVGLLASALIAIPILTATSAYVASEMFGWGGSINKQFWRAKKFYMTVIATLVFSSAVALAGIPPIKLLFISSIVGGLATPITLTLMMLIAGDRRTMKRKRLNPLLLGSGWAVTTVVSAAGGIFLFQTFTGR
ncbi:MAG: divalent metal cation transporter [Candidatus Eremiobacteraeota bacterium]|nr:divalent metal cation transporter [Candidatus Eremiobacteraeota bacterium]